MCEGVTSFKISQGFVEFQLLFVLDLQLSSFNGVFVKRQPYTLNRGSELKSQLENKLFLTSVG